jgi:hypothetical protein
MNLKNEELLIHEIRGVFISKILFIYLNTKKSKIIEVGQK